MCCVRCRLRGKYRGPGLVEEAKDFATGVLTASLLVVHDAECGRQHDVSELRKEETEYVVKTRKRAGT